MNKRNSNIECLRVVMMLFIIMLHLTGEFYDLNEIALVSGNVEISALFGLRSLLMLGVSTFAFISGYYGISPKGRLRKFINYELMAIELGGAILILECLSGNLLVRDILVFLMPISSGCCWYFSAYMTLLIFEPIVSRGLSQLSKNEFRLIILAVFVVEYFGYWMFNVLSTDFLTLFGIYLIGRYIWLYPLRILNSVSYCHLLVAILFNFAVSALLVFYGYGKAIKYIENNHNPMIFVTAVIFFFVVIKLKQTIISERLSYIAKYAFPIYIGHVSLLHAGIIDFKQYQFVSPICSVVLYAFVVYIAFAALEIIRFSLLRPVNKSLENVIMIKFEQIKNLYN